MERRPTLPRYEGNDDYIRRLVKALNEDGALRAMDFGMHIRRNPAARARAYLSAEQSNIPNDTLTKINLNTESYDTGGNFDTAAYKFVTPRPGFYDIKGQVRWKTGTVVADKSYLCAIYYDSSLIVSNTVHSASTGVLDTHTSDTQYFEGNKDIELYCWHNAGVDTVDIVHGSQKTYLAVHLLSV